MTEQQQRIVDYIRAFRQEHAYGPSVREIAAAVDFSSTSTCVRNLKLLEQQGVVTWDSYIARSIRLTDR